jgi:uncharacterized protein (DUF1697 family)
VTNVPYVAFLRGINVGGRTIKMAELKICMEKLGFSNVSTLLQSGNILFESSETQVDLKSIIERALQTRFGFSVKVQVYTKDALKTVVTKFPFETKDQYHNYAIFFENDLETDFSNNVLEIKSDVDKVQKGSGVIYWQVPIGMTLKSPVSKLLTKTKYKEFNTNRNLNTLIKMLQT